MGWIGTYIAIYKYMNLGDIEMEEKCDFLNKEYYCISMDQ